MTNKKLIEKYKKNGFTCTQIDNSSDFALLTIPIDGGLFFSTVPLYEKIKESQMGITIIDSKKDLKTFINGITEAFKVGSSKEFMEEVNWELEEKPMSYYSSPEYFDEIED
jgi:hypothetical protein